MPPFHVQSVHVVILLLSMLQYCWMMGGYLAELATQQEEYAVQQYLPAGNHYWIGLNDQAQEGEQLRIDIIADYNYPPCRSLDLV